MLDDPFAESLTRVRPRWHSDAACREHPEINFFPERGENVRPALAVCERCLVRAECARAGAEIRQPGIWGGTTFRQRRLARSELHAAA